MASRARELDPNLRRLTPYRRPNMEGRIRHDELWARMARVWRPGTRVEVRFEGDVAHLRVYPLDG